MAGSSVVMNAITQCTLFIHYHLLTKICVFWLPKIFSSSRLGNGDLHAKYQTNFTKNGPSTCTLLAIGEMFSVQTSS